jgi:hypothetical protein
MVWKLVTNTDPGDASHFGGDDLDKVHNLFNGILNVDSVDINSVFTFRNSKMRFRNPANTFSYTIDTGAITANHTISLPVAEGADEILFANAPAGIGIENKTINSFSNTVHADVMHLSIRNESGGPITKGTLVYISGYSIPQSRPLVSLADASAGASMPAIGMVSDTSIYVSTTAGQFSAQPTGATDLVQKFATVLREDAALGEIDIRGAGRSNATPNLADANLWVGNVTNQAVAVAPGGDVSMDNAGLFTIANTAVTLAKMANMATASLLGRNTAGTGVPEVLSATTARSLLNVADGANNYSHPNHTGDVTSTGDGAQTIADEAVTLAKMAHVATATFLGRTTAATGDVEAMTTAQATALIDEFTSVLSGVVPASGGGTTNFLRADGTWTTATATDITQFPINAVLECPQGVVAYPDIHSLATAGAKVSGFVMPNGASVSTVNFKVQVPAGISGTPNMKMRFKIMTRSALTGDVRLTVKTIGVNDTENLDQALTAETETTVTMPTAIETLDYYSQDLTTDWAAGDMIIGQIARDPADAADDYAGDIMIVQAELLTDLTLS